MSSFQDPLRRVENAKVSKVQPTSPLEKDKKQNIKNKHPAPDESSESDNDSLSLASILHTISSAVEEIEQNLKNGSTPLEGEKSKELIKLNELFYNLSHKDLSHEIDFLTELSLRWHNIIELLSKTPESPNARYFSTLCESIMNYKSSSEHSLGFYLTEKTDENWTPFPLMKLLQNLHNEYQESPDTSNLKKWSYLIEKMIGIL